MKRLVTIICAFACTAAFADGTSSVAVPSLKVKERLQSIEQINVTAEKQAKAEQPQSEAVEALLAEAEKLDEQDMAQPSSH
jgi:small-conductance mechanosensitive channel